jgi:beta-glucosidase
MTMKHFRLAKTSSMMQPDFIFGVATSSYQIEGARNSRLKANWDTFCEKDGTIADNSNGDISCEHVKYWQDDVAIMADIGVDAYRLSLSWCRVMLADGTVNLEGVKFYIDLFKALKAQGIKIFVTFYHWDLPEYLESQGGWLNRQTAFEFANYVETITPYISPYVDSFATLNEPFCSAYLGYELGIHAPGYTSQKAGKLAAHHLLLAHGLAMEVLTRLSPTTENGIVLNFSPCYPLTDSNEDAVACRYADEYLNTWYLMPLLEGRYPDIKNLLPDDVQPNIAEGDMAIISTPIDFIGINYYTRKVYQAGNNVLFKEVESNQYAKTAMGWEVVSSAFFDLLTDLNNRFDLPHIYITENGAAFDDEIIDGEVNDLARVDYIDEHLLAVEQAIQHGVPVKGYFVWSLLDNFEWSEGYTKRFGIVHVDYTSQKRTLKHSALSYKALINARNSNQ